LQQEINTLQIYREMIQLYI